MNLLWPVALWGLLTIPFILLLHLLRNRRAQIDIPSLRLWRGLERKRQGGLPRHIPLSVMLILQLLIAGALTLGLARPALSFLLAQPQQIIFILDLTTSMTAEDVAGEGNVGNRRRFDTARQFIQDQLQALGQHDTFAVISLDPRPQLLFSGGSEQKMPARLALDNLVPGATGVDLPAALTLANGLIDDPQRGHQIIVLTDGNFPQPEALPPLLAPLRWQLIPGGSRGVSNQALLNVSASPLPDGRHRIFARLVNYSETLTRRTVRISTEQGPFDEVTLQLAPQAETAQIWTLPAQAQVATVEIVEPDALALDNRAQLWLTGSTQQQVLLVSAASESPEAAIEGEGEVNALALALQVQPGVELTAATFDALETGQIDLTDFDLVVYDGLPATMTAWPPGNVLVVNPPLGHSLLAAQNFGRMLRPEINADQADSSATLSTLLKGVDLSGVYFDRVPQLTLPAWAEVDLVAVPLAGQPESPTPLIFHGNVDDSRLVVWAFDLAASNLPARLALPILTANTLATLLAPAPPAVVPVGEPVVLDGNYTIEVPGGRRLAAEPVIEQNQDVFSHTKQPGLYRIYNDRDHLVAGFAVHAGSALESNLTGPLQPETLNLTYVSAKTGPNPQFDFQEYWPWLAGLALLVVVLEGWLAWRR